MDIYGKVLAIHFALKFDLVSILFHNIITIQFRENLRAFWFSILYGKR